MAPNPLHALVLLPLYLKRPSAFDPAALVVSSVAIDLEVVFAYIMGYETPHLALHSFAVALTVYPLAISLMVYALERKGGALLGRVYRRARWGERVAYPFRTVFACSLLGGLGHIFLDMWTHPVSPYLFWPFAYLPANPLYLGAWSVAVDGAAVLVGLYAVYLWGRLWKKSPSPAE